MPSPILNTAYLEEQLQARIAELSFKPNDKGVPEPLKLYKERPDLRNCPAQRIDQNYGIRHRRVRNTKAQRAHAGFVHVVHMVELQVAKRFDNKDYHGMHVELTSRVEQLISALIGKSLGGLDAEWEDTIYDTDLGTSVIYATITLTISGFWAHASQHSS